MHPQLLKHLAEILGCATTEVVRQNSKWEYGEVEDLGVATRGHCPCGQVIRYRHHIMHPEGAMTFVGSECISHFGNAQLRSDADYATKSLTHDDCKDCGEMRPRKNGVYVSTGFKSSDGSQPIGRRFCCCRCTKKLRTCGHGPGDVGFALVDSQTARRTLNICGLCVQGHVSAGALRRCTNCACFIEGPKWRKTCFTCYKRGQAAAPPSI